MRTIYFQSKAETVILIAAHWHRAKLPQWGLRRLFSQLPELAKVASAYSSSSRLPNVFLEYAHGVWGVGGGGRGGWGCYL